MSRCMGNNIIATPNIDAMANDGIQAHGGYGYIREYEVEKIKRDVRILPIYEGTSEIQRNIISMFRMRSSVRSGGKFYSDMAETLEKLSEETGGPLVAKAIRVLNDVVLGARKNKLTKQQFVMFLLADMMTWCEIGKALCIKASGKGLSDKRTPEFLKTCARIFAREVIEKVTINGLKISQGCGTEINDLTKKIRGLNIETAFLNNMKDMDSIADELTA